MFFYDKNEKRNNLSYKNLKAIVKQPSDGLTRGAVKMPPLDPSATLASRIGPQSLHFFKALKVGTTWLGEPVESWEEIPAFQKFSKFARSVPVANDMCERMVKRTTDFKDYGGKTEDDFQGNLHVVGAAIAKVPSRRTKSALAKAYGQQ